jgi:uncharacterized protein
MDRKTYELLENYMISCMQDSAHDKEHVYRVLFHALEIAKEETSVDYDILLCAALLHDIGRKEQFENPALCHAQVGAEKARVFLQDHGFSAAYADKVAHCIASHRFRKGNAPQSIEAKVLFDADKLDVAGATGMARTLMYVGAVAEPLYSLREDGSVSNGEKDRQISFFQEYKFKLENLYDHFYTQKGRELALSRQAAAAAFYDSLYTEVQSAYEIGKQQLQCALQ